MVEGTRDRREQPPTGLIKAPVWPEEEGSQKAGGQSRDEYGGRTVPKA